MVLAVLGVCRTQSDLAPLYAGAERFVEGEAVVSGRVERPPERREGEMLLRVADVRIRRGSSTTACRWPLQIVIPAGKGEFRVGDLVSARGQLRALRGDRNLGWFPGPVASAGERVAARLSVSSPVWVRRWGHDDGRGPGAVVLGLRAAADGFWKQFASPSAAILNALTTGERASIPDQVREDFLRSGLTHLLAISGMNVAFLAALVFLLLRRALALCEPLVLRLPAQPLAALLTLPALWFFLLFSGSQVPVGRAVLSGAAALLAVVFLRRVHPGDACALAALVLLALDPRVLFSPGFQLSFAAVGALLLAAPLVARGAGRQEGEALARRIARGTRGVFLVSLAASAATAPIVAFTFQQVSLVGPVANVLAVPLTGFVVLPAAWGCLVAAALPGAAAEYCVRAALHAGDALLALASWFAAPGWAVVRPSRPPPLALLLFLAALLAFLLAARRSQWRPVVGGAGALVAGAATWCLAGPGAGELTVVFLDVGQGLSVAALLPGGESLLYDSGPAWRGYDAGARVVVPALRGLGVRRLQTLARSHAHPDHAGGEPSVRREVGGAGIATLGEILPVRVGAKIPLAPGVSLRALSSGADAGGGRTDNENERSLALLLAHGDNGFVLSGDAGPALAARIAAAMPGEPRNLVLQAPHHGGSPEACAILAEALRPQIAVIPVGRNSYGHPRAGAVAALAARARVLRSDRDGGVFVRSDGRSLQVRTWRELALDRTWAERVRWLVRGW